jgi:hypothetical protein
MQVLLFANLMQVLLLLYSGIYFRCSFIINIIIIIIIIC